MKVCSKCKIEKDDSDFYKCSSREDGLQSYCKECKKQYQKKYQKLNKNKKIRKKYRQSDEFKQYMKKYNQSYKSKEYFKRYCQSNKYKEYQKKYQESDKSKNNNSYLKNCLNLKNIPTELIPPELLELKRAQLKVTRLLKKIGEKNEKTITTETNGN